MKDLEIIEKKIITISTINPNHSNLARLIIDKDIATLEIESEVNNIYYLIMTKSELEQIGLMFSEKAREMKEKT